MNAALAVAARSGADSAPVARQQASAGRGGDFASLLGASSASTAAAPAVADRPSSNVAVQANTAPPAQTADPQPGASCAAADGTRSSAAAAADHQHVADPRAPASDSVNEASATLGGSPVDAEAPAANDAHDVDTQDDVGTADQDADAPGWLQSLRQSLSLLFGAAPAAPAEDVPESAATTAPPIAPHPASATAPGAVAAVVPDADGITALGDLDPAGADKAQPDAAPFVDRQRPVGDARFDAMLSALQSHDAGASAHGIASAAVAPASATPNAGSTTPPVHTPPMTLPPEHSQFVESLGERIVWAADGAANGELSQATIELHPAELGCLRIQVQMRGDTAHVAFSADNPATRALLSDALPQLREMMSAQGVQLLRAQVDARSVPNGRQAATSGSVAVAESDSTSAASRRRVTRVKLVDAYV
ncbi:flagellar hook-length control protein FliK [Solimonas marina]|uniref:Flagellar hook-length control protein-like C-terminal domain-containing protein n=1 Tax=Solimonas marina TaxID=2714601 RepID=A0A970B5L1_9GAMM|nr:flagellar hook-length control protein FliK [Solimonas marina]NKF21695.1 hypothetical protein [Solimonas marina]